jgi:LAO/AO transport system kinase
MSAAPPASGRLLADFAARKPAALARVISIVENRGAESAQLLAALHGATGHARRIGITGPPGAGKSTLVAHLVRAYRSQGLTAGVVAVDPTSAFTGGALLGDRIRMEAIALDPGVYIRSLATRGALGGLSAATREIADVLDAYGFDRVLVETVGVGQSELEVARTADSCVVVLVPESGDAIQTLKAGLMEIADVFVVNKADRPGADRLRTELKVMLQVRSGSRRGQLASARSAGADMSGEPAAASQGGGAAGADGSAWVPPVLTAVAAEGTGIPEILGALDSHHDYLVATGVLAEQRRARLRARVAEVADLELRRRLWGDAATTAWLDGRLAALDSGETTPFEVARELLQRSGRLLAGEGDDTAQ